MTKKVVIIGAGPAGLTAAYELLKESQEFDITVVEELSLVGGISRTVNYKGNRMDMGGHRLFSKVPAVNAWWEEMLPMQDGINGPDPEKNDRVMLKRKRLSRIFFNQQFYNYPISLNAETIKNMGFKTTIVVGGSYLKSALHKRPEKSLEDFYINRFGKKLYSMFFENYTENLWGRHPREISAEWGAQRVKGISIAAILKDILRKSFKKNNRVVETSLIEEFCYPKLGPGQLWEVVAEKIEKLGGKIIMEAKVVGIKKNKNNKIEAIVYRKNNKEYTVKADYVISSMPIKDLAESINGVPEKIKKVAEGLPYRDFMTVGVLMPKTSFKKELKDNWIYVHDKKVKMGRIQIFNNWSPYLVKDSKHNIWIGLEYFCNEGDELWNMNDQDFSKMAISEMKTIGILNKNPKILDYHVERVKKAYPAYFDTYKNIDKLRNYFDKIPNLFLVGRNGQHRYNNLDHSMCTSFEATKNIIHGVKTKNNIWSVNTEQEYHEKKS